MKLILGSIFFSFCYMSGIGQTTLFGKYVFSNNKEQSGSLVLNCNYEFRLDDTIIISKDTLITSVVLGSWKINKNKMLVLSVAAILSDYEPFGNLKKLRYIISDKRLYLQLQSEKQYTKQNKKFENKYKIRSEMQKDYETYKMEQKENYFLLIQNYNCE